MRLHLIILLIAPFSFSQWQAGASYKIKNETPENGFGIHISRNLPYQGATFGIKVRGEVNLFRESETEIISGKNIKQKYQSEDYILNIIGNYYFKNFSPYFGFGMGYGRVGINRSGNGSLLLTLLAGLSLPINFINPFIEIQGVNYFSDFDSALAGKDISSFQIRGVVGVSFTINTLRN